MIDEIKIPKLGATVKKAKIAKWLVKPGQSISKGAVLCELETEKVTFKVEAENEGVLVNVGCKAGTVVQVGQVIGTLGPLGTTVEISRDSDEPADTSKDSSKSMNDVGSGKPSAASKERIFSTPFARKLAEEKGIPLTVLNGSGPGGRIVKDDVLAYELTAVTTDNESGLVQPLKGLGVDIPLTQMRRVIGDRLTESSRNVPHVYFSAEIDCKSLVHFRSIFKPIIAKQDDGVFSFNDLIIKAVSRTILKYPMFNGTLTEDAISIRPSIDIGLAMAVPAGLIVPVIRNTERLSVADISQVRRELTSKAQEGSLSVDEMSGGTFTISSLGQFKIDSFNSIINPPETAILSVTRMKDRPVAVDGQVVVRPTMFLSLSIDHRVVDGADGARFLEDLKDLLENPYEMCTL